jgi:hypothetical protein
MYPNGIFSNLLQVGGYTQPELRPASARCSFLEETFPGAVEREGIHLPGGVVAVDGMIFGCDKKNSPNPKNSGSE